MKIELEIPDNTVGIAMMIVENRPDNNTILNRQLDRNDILKMEVKKQND